MSNPKFSIITPVFNGEKTISRTIKSVINQSFEDWEYIIVDDNSTDESRGIANSFRLIDKRITLLHSTEHQHKAISRNIGMDRATGEWICWLDADDFYLPFYLEVLDQAMRRFPNYDVFYFGGIVVWNNWGVSLRMPLVHHKDEIFGSGDIMSGGFIFRRACLEKTGFLPEARDPYTFGRKIKKMFPELVEIYGEREDLGNPWGDDWAFFYMLTRHYEPKKLNIAPYVVMIRGQKELPYGND